MEELDNLITLHKDKISALKSSGWSPIKSIWLLWANEDLQNLYKHRNELIKSKNKQA